MKHNIASKLSVLVLLAITMVACSSGSGSYSKRNRGFFDALLGSDSYEKAFNKRTKYRRVHSEFEPVLNAHATFWDKELSQIYVIEKAARYRLSEEDEGNLIKQELSDLDSHFVFIVSVLTRENSWNRLERRDHLWRLTLESPNGSVQAEPKYVEVVSNKNEQARYFYKKMTPFNRTYKVVFPKEPLVDLSEVVFHISGPRGNISFPFKTKENG